MVGTYYDMDDDSIAIGNAKFKYNYAVDLFGQEYVDEFFEIAKKENNNIVYTVDETATQKACNFINSCVPNVVKGAKNHTPYIDPANGLYVTFGCRLILEGDKFEIYYSLDELHDEFCKQINQYLENKSRVIVRKYPVVTLVSNIPRGVPYYKLNCRIIADNEEFPLKEQIDN